MSLTTYVYFDLTATNIGPYFVLDDPVQGLLDGSYVLGGDIAVDVTEQGLSLSTRRGRNVELDNIDVGSATLVLDNESRDFDPTYTGSPYTGNVKPWKRVQFLVDDVPIFTGHVEDWNFNYTMDGDATATAVCVDALAILGGSELDAHTASAQATGARVTAVLDRSEVLFPATRDIDTGEATLQADTVDAGTNTLQYLQNVALAEFGYLYPAADGVLRFRERNTSLTTSPVVFSNDGTGISYTGINIVYGNELLYNRISVERAGGTAQTAEDTASQTDYGVKAYSLTGLLYADDTQSGNLADYLAATYSEPRLRISQLVLNLDDLETEDRATVLAIDLADLVSVSFQPPGPTEAIERTLRVEGISHQIAVDRDHMVTFDLSDVQLAFVLDDAELGVLDANVLGF